MNDNTEDDGQDVLPPPDPERFRRPAIDAELRVELFDSIRQADGNPVQPVRLQAADSFCFSCHKSVACWNRCCHGADIVLTPGDILQLSRELAIQPAEFLAQYTYPAMWEKSDLPVAKLRMSGDDGTGACIFLAGESGCGVYAARPVTCRYYPLGLASVKMTGDEHKADFHFLVKESHCQGHTESKHQTVAEFRAEQGVAALDDVNRGWIDIMMKMVSWRSVGGPNAKQVSPQAKKMFFMVSTDVCAFRRFVFETRFLQTYLLDDEAVEILRTDDIALLKLGFDWLKNVLFNENTINLREDVLQAAIARSRSELGAT